MKNKFSKFFIGALASTALLISGTSVMAADITTEIEIFGGDLVIETVGPPVIEQEYPFVGYDTRTIVIMPTFRVIDTRGTLDGYKISYSVSDFVHKEDSLAVISRDNIQLKSDAFAGTDYTGTAISDAVLTGKSASEINFANDYKIIDFGANQGMGENTFTGLGFVLNLDKEFTTTMKAGEYSSTSTIAVYTGP